MPTSPAPSALRERGNVVSQGESVPGVLHVERKLERKLGA